MKTGLHFLLFALTWLAFTSKAHASELDATTESVNVDDLISSQGAPAFGNFAALVGLKSTNDTGRVYQMEQSTGERYKLKNEYYFGFEHMPSQWSLSGVAETKGASYGDTNNNSYQSTDPSVILQPPDIYNDGDINVHNNFRVFFPATAASQPEHITEYGYNLYFLQKMAHGWNLSNEVQPKYFHQTYYKKGDLISDVEDYLEYSKEVLRWVRVGFGQHFERDWHRSTPTGTIEELYPYADFVVRKQTIIEPRIYFPVYVQNTVSGGPNAVALNNVQLEVILKVSI